MIPLHKPPLGAEELASVSAALAGGVLDGDGPYGRLCSHELKRITGAKAVLLTPSATAALELIALLLDIKPGDEIIMPSFTFPSAANAFALRGAKLVFVDIRPQDMNMDPDLAAAAVTPATRAIAPMHYAGMACDMRRLMAVAARHGLPVIEDAAMSLDAYDGGGRHLGSIGLMGCLSFHQSKNLSMGEGGALLLNDGGLLARAEMIRDKGTDRARFRRGEVDAYCWQSLGSSYLVSELNAACLLPQLQRAGEITAARREIWHLYQRAFAPLAALGCIETPRPADNARHNAHIYYIKTRDAAERGRLIRHLAARGIMAASHYQPLHSAPAGRVYGRLAGEDAHTSREAGRLLRLPLWAGISARQADTVARAVFDFYSVNYTAMF